VVKLVFLGPPGAGKGTQAARMAEFYQVPHISTGEILRNNVIQKTPLGIQAKLYMNRGDLVPDKLILGMVEHRLKGPDTENGWILDGFPRNVNQAYFVEKLLFASKNEKAKVSNPFLVINIEVPGEILVSRLLSRGRKDDNEETIKKRLEVYHQQTKPVVDFYKERQQLVDIDGNQSIDAVTDSLKQAVNLSC
jgi:adenylate kinase